MKISNYCEDVVDVYAQYRQPIGVNMILDKIRSNFPTLQNKDIHILDCGGGCGNYSKVLYKHGFKITLVDQNESMLEKLRKENLKGLDIVSANITEPLPFENNTFDVIIINQVIHHFGDNDKEFYHHTNLFNECSRILKYDGLFSINTCNHDNYQYGYWWSELVMDNIEPYYSRYCPEEKLLKLLQKSGFKSTKKICTEPFIGKTYFTKEFIFNPDVRKTDTVWKYISDETYRMMLDHYKKMSHEDFTQLFEDRLQLMNQYGQSIFVFSTKR